MYNSIGNNSLLWLQTADFLSLINTYVDTGTEGACASSTVAPSFQPDGTQWTCINFRRVICDWKPTTKFPSYFHILHCNASAIYETIMSYFCPCIWRCLRLTGLFWQCRVHARFRHWPCTIHPTRNYNGEFRTAALGWRYGLDTADNQNDPRGVQPVPNDRPKPTVIIDDTLIVVLVLHINVVFIGRSRCGSFCIGLRSENKSPYRSSEWSHVADEVTQ